MKKYRINCDVGLTNKTTVLTVYRRVRFFRWSFWLFIGQRSYHLFDHRGLKELAQLCSRYGTEPRYI